VDLLEPVKGSLQLLVHELGVRKEISDVLFAVFPNEEFAVFYGSFKDALARPDSLEPFISELQRKFNLGVTGHIMIAVRRFLTLKDFEVFTRDYVRRCCDMVEYFTKSRIAQNWEPVVTKKPLGAVIQVLQKNGYSRRFPDCFLDTLALFNKTIYCPAKHEMSTKEDERMYSVADAIAITFITVRLCQQLDDFHRKHFF
jgi:hypothetical protein